MKATMIKRFNIVISLWCIAIIALLCVFGFQLNNSGCYVAALVFAGLLMASNVINLISGLSNSRIKLHKSEEQYNR